MDAVEFVAVKLREWNLAEYIDEFHKQQIDKETFLSFPDAEARELIPIAGHRFTFIRKRNEYLAEINKDAVPASSASQETVSFETHDASNRAADKKPETESQNQPTAGEVSSPTINGSTGQTLKKLLLASKSKGEYLLDLKILSRADRLDLVAIIAEEILALAKKNKRKIKPDDYIFWSEEIAGLYKNEKAAAYYCYRTSDQDTYGKLYFKVGNLRKKYKPILKKSVPLDTASSSKPSDETNAALLELQAVALDDAKTIETLWDKTYELRDKSQEICEYFKTYPMLTAPLGVKLIKLDFNKLNLVEDENIFVKKWPSISERLFLYSERSSVCREIRQSLGADIDVEIGGLFVLPYLFPLTQVKSLSKWRPSYREREEGFILRVDNMGNLEQKLAERKKQLKKYRTTSQPFVVIIGESNHIDAVYVIIEETKYLFGNLVAAVDFCFKSFFALDLLYPTESKILWVFLERHVYGITQTNCKLTSITTLMSDLQSVEVGSKNNEEKEADDVSD